ncbi:amidohydrolase [Neolewinella lacunae]|uniref:Amidohydrolase n=1 Tax=Neolewinella lacunae TaxID=1517758 RepID=A0A923T6P7_9BACT|nr:amidohydrolase [Neolewinella lacunae]MBC6992816.1 amidohydrolase [Neolewinella lacunae]MDN3636095.1 amidohydrolase [Neolewinella lacunae]
MRKFFFLTLLLALGMFLAAQTDYAATAKAAAAVESKVIAWRHHLHEHPELSNREFETAKYVEKHLRELGMEVRTGVAYTGVIGVLRGGKPGGVIALRADMDALPVVEAVDLPYASKVRTTYLDQEVGVMHACGHDTHVAMLMGAAEILSQRKAELAGTVVFIFQPAEEGPPVEEGGGAKMIVDQGILEEYGVQTAFGIHINSQTPIGHVNYKPGGAMAASNTFEIKVKGKQAHGSAPWAGVDPVVAAAQIILGLQTIVSRQMELTKEPAVISVGKITGGVRSNIIPDEVTMIGTIRTLDRDMQKDIFERIRTTATHIAASSGAEATVTIQEGTLITYNDPEITRQLMPTVVATAGENNVHLVRPITGAEDFSFYAAKVPSLFIFLGGMDPAMDRNEAPGHHTPQFRIDDRGMKLGVELYTNIALDYLQQARK